ncbi:MAG: hypothetical protein ACJ74Y_07495, partial [Bryobacteraceae bacterium]
DPLCSAAIQVGSPDAEQHPPARYYICTLRAVLLLVFSRVCAPQIRAIHYGIGSSSVLHPLCGIRIRAFHSPFQ